MTNHDLGILVVGHGTRDPIGQAQMRNLACQVAGCLAPLKTDLGFLELAEPSIAAGIDRLAAAGIKRLIVAPVLLFRAGHADRDIPEAVDAAAERHGIQVLAHTPPLESQPAVLELSAERFREAIATHYTASSAAAAELISNHLAGCEPIHLVMIARGSSSASAAEKMEKFATDRCQITAVAAHRVGYVAVRQPDVAQSLMWLADSSARTLVVQPHLLFEGEVLHSLISAVEARRQADGRNWVVCKPLGASVDHFEDDRLARVFAHLVRQTLAECTNESLPAPIS